MAKKERKPTKVKTFLDPDLAKEWKKYRGKYPYLFWIRSMNVGDDDEWYELIKGREPDLTHAPTVPKNAEEFLKIAESRREIYYQLARCYTQPSEELVEDIMNNSFSDSVRKCCGFRDVRVDEGLRTISKFIEKFEGIEIKELWDNLSREHLTIFYDGYLPWISCYESIYRSEKQIMGDVTMEVKKSYADAGFGISLRHGNELPDDLKLEMEFMYRLCELEISAWKSGDREAAIRYMRLQKEFLTQHALEWIPYLCDDLYNPEFKLGLGKKLHYEEEMARKYEGETVEADFYRGVALITKSVLEHDHTQIDAMLSAAEKLDLNEISKLSKKIKEKDASREMFYLEPIGSSDAIPYLPRNPQFTE